MFYKITDNVTYDAQNMSVHVSGDLKHLEAEGMYDYETIAGEYPPVPQVNITMSLDEQLVRVFFVDFSWGLVASIQFSLQVTKFTRRYLKHL